MFGLPIFMLWLSNVGTLLAQTFTFLYANVCCFVCRRGKRKKGTFIACFFYINILFDKIMTPTKRQKSITISTEFQRTQKIIIVIIHSEKRARLRAEQRERESRGGSEGVKLLWSENGRDVSPALTTSTRLDGGLAREPGNGSYSMQSTLKMDPRLKEMLNTCASYNIDQGDDDDPLSEAVVEELRHADKMDIINERSLAASPLNSPSKSHNKFLGLL